MLRRLIGAVVAAIAAALALAGPAFARSADITSAEVELRLAPDGALLVTERLTFEYDGHYEGSYRDLNLNFGERITDVQVSQDGQQFEPGGNTGLGSFDRPGVFGTVVTVKTMGASVEPATAAVTVVVPSTPVPV